MDKGAVLAGDQSLMIYILHLVSWEIEVFGKMYSTIYRRIKSHNILKNEQILALLAKVLSLSPSNESTMYRRSDFLTASAQNRPQGIQSHRSIN